ncbi:hypothetical protein [Amycolatopsis jejuensis]|uniref:hypothetical protein n=1 Tax=Amycolatopsis jejuensis TaxID=330084 RepID=UPI0012E09EAA|nr:hypothetical protein [Amycolatopsis jejuensis]
MQAFPAIVDDKRWNGFAVPRFRRPVAEAVARWLTGMHTRHPSTWPDTARFDSETLTVQAATGAETERTNPDDNGRYPIGYRTWHWELTAPLADSTVLDGTARLTTEPDEILVTINICGTDPAFPALASATHGWSRAGCPRFRRPVAEAVVAWLNATAADCRDGSVDAYWDGDTVVLVDYQYIAEDGYLPDRISPDDDGRYSIGATFEWERAD